MIELIHAARIVGLVIHEGKDYTKAIDHVFPLEGKVFQSSNISIRLAFHALKHYYLYENIVNQINLRPAKNKKCLLYVVLTNNLFCRLIPVNYANGFLEGFFNPEDFKKLLPFLKRKTPIEDAISFEKDSDFYFATKYNTPTWLIHMWRKHFGDETTISFLEATSSFDLQSYCVNTLKTTAAKLIEQYPDFSSPFDGLLVYHGTLRFYITKEYKNDEYFKVKIAFKSLLDDLLDEYTETLIYSGYDDDFVKTAIVKSNRKQSLNIAVPNLDKRGEIMRFIRTNQVRNVNLFEAKDEFSLKAGVSYKQDLVIVFPRSSRFDIISQYPDYLLHFDRDCLDELIADEKANLELFSTRVSDGGTLVYLVNTLNKKEGQNIIKEFLENHSEFELETENQLISSHPFATTVYYAILRRKESEHD